MQRSRQPGEIPPHRSFVRFPASWRDWLPNILGVIWVIAAAGAMLRPALAHGLTLGPFDILAKEGLTNQPGVVVHNPWTSDQIALFSPWTDLAWTQVHQGHLPLWNPYSALGMPLAFNWQSATFSLPALIGYLFPLHLAYTVQIVVTLIIAGTGAYLLGRVLHLGVLASAFAATVFELSGPMIGWLGYPHAAVMSWGGWIFSAAILIVRGQHRIRYITSFAIVAALALYAGQPEIQTLLGIAVIVFLAVLLALRIPRFGGSGPIRRPIIDLLTASIAGASLASPLVLPGIQVAAGSVKTSIRPTFANGIATVLVQGFNGSTINETAVYFGVIALVLAVVGVAMRWQRPEVKALTAVAVVTGALAFLTPVQKIMNLMPIVGGVVWHRGRLPLALVVAVLAGMGMDVLVHSWRERNVLYWTGSGFVVAGLALLAVYDFGRGHLPPLQAAIRSASFKWPIIEVAVGVAGVGLLVFVRQRGHRDRSTWHHLPIGAGVLVGLSLLICETAFLVDAGAPVLSSSRQFFPATSAVAKLQRAVGSSLVGFGTGASVGKLFIPPCFHSGGLGINIDTNIVYGVRELAVYEPMTPLRYFSVWRTASHGQSGGWPFYITYCPAVTTTTEAQLYGVSYVLERAGTPGPQGGIFDEKVGNESLYRIPGAADAILVPASASGTYPPLAAPGSPVDVTHPDDASWKLVTRGSGPHVLRLHLTDLPGWHATIDGRALPLQSFAGVMLQARVPGGVHTIELYYWPTTFTIGIVLAACSGFGLCFAVIIGAYRRRHLMTSASSQSIPNRPEE